MTIENSEKSKHKKHRPSLMHQRKSTAWTQGEDRTLIDMRRRNIKWPDISKAFEDKTPNACRKRYERLVETSAKDRATADIKNEPLGRAYKQYRKEFWMRIAHDIGLEQDRWETVESTAFSWGLAQLNIFERRSRRERDESMSNSGDRQRTSPDTDDSDSILSDSTSGGVSTMFQRAQLQSSPQFVAGESSRTFPSFSRMNSSQNVVGSSGTGRLASSYESHPPPDPYHQQQYSSASHAYLPTQTHHAPKSWSPQERPNLRLPHPSSQNFYASHSPDISGYHAHSSSNLPRADYSLEPQYPLPIALSPIPPSLPSLNAAVKPASIDSMLHNPTRTSPGDGPLRER